MQQVSNYIYMQDSPVNEFVHEPGKDLLNNECTFVHNDVIILFNQQRLESLGHDTAQSILDSFAPSNSSLQSVREKLSDEQLLSLIKSRHIQSHCDLLKYMETLEKDRSLLEQEIVKAQVNLDSSKDVPSNSVISDSKSE